ncbi:hypothetical protein C8J57DRAFT_1639970 [Mycena rebaudengoi]|nr:hypothetical protein C8J57DRAFT_1639970 [Mycena rebaudengoi]
MPSALRETVEGFKWFDSAEELPYLDSDNEVDLLPLLKEYRGIPETLNVFLPLPSLTDLTIDLKGIGASNNLTSLSVSFLSINHALFREFCGLFPRLSRLRMTVHDGEVAEGVDDEDMDAARDWNIPQFLFALAKSSVLPTHLMHLAIFWNDECQYTRCPPAFSTFRDAIMKKCPSLNALWMGLYGFTIRCRKASGGKVSTEVEVADEHHETVRRMHRDFDHSWTALEVQAH